MKKELIAVKNRIKKLKDKKALIDEECTDPKKLDQNLTIRRSVFLWQNIVLNSRRKLF